MLSSSVLEPNTDFCCFIRQEGEKTYRLGIFVEEDWFIKLYWFTLTELASG